MSVVRLLPWIVHQAIEYLAGVFFVLAPFLFGFADDPALGVFVGIGFVVLAVAVLTAGPIGIVKVLPTKVHATLDYVLAFFLLIAPFVLGFTDVEAALYISILLGVAHLVITLTTRFPLTDEEASRSAPAG